MNECCMVKGNAQIIHSKKPSIHWRVVCQWCGLVLHEQKQKGEENNEKSDKNKN